MVAPRSMTFQAQPRPSGTCTPFCSLSIDAVHNSSRSSAGGWPAHASKVPSPASGFENTTLKYVFRVASFTNQQSPLTPRKNSSLQNSSRVLLVGGITGTGFECHRPASNQSPSNKKFSSLRLSISMTNRLSTTVMADDVELVLGVQPSSTFETPVSWRVDLQSLAFDKRLLNSSETPCISPSDGRTTHRTIICSSCNSSVSHAHPSARRSPAPGRPSSGT
mmetsp:Transcript_90437/g.156739  ORF Transcript_90437/g.156739 Transcript_90437/m.156739 type:complete len:221 (-) Transcript_90437:490-1152(-)